MFTKCTYYMVILTETEDVAEVMKMASRYNLVAMHKKGIYETVEQNELYCKGKWIDMYRFAKELNKARTTKK